MSSPDKAALFSHDSEESDDDVDSIAWSNSNLPPPLLLLDPSALDNFSSPLTSSGDVTGNTTATSTALESHEVYSVINESGADLLAAIKQKVNITQLGRGPNISRLWKDNNKIMKSWRICA